MAYASVRGTLVHFDAFTTDTWEWSPAGRSWTKLCGEGTACDRHPLAMLDPTLVYDAARDRGELVELGWTWEWDGAERVWSVATRSGPSIRSGLSMAYDSTRRKVMLFGGYEPGWGGAEDDLWEYDGRTREWIQVCGGDTGCLGPPGRSVQSITYDPSRQRLVTYGGYGAEIETWEWDAAAGRWDKTCGPGTDCTCPPERADQAVSYDPGRERVVLHGGYEDMMNDVLYDDLWEYDSGRRRWDLVEGGGVESPRLHAWHSLAVDSDRGVVVFYGAGYRGPAELWEWDPAIEVWHRVCGPATACQAPSMPGNDAIVYDPRAGRTVVFGVDETWAWDGVTRSWEHLCGDGTDCVNPRFPTPPLASLDPVRGCPVVVTETGQIREFDSVQRSWRDVCAPGVECAFPDPFGGGAVAHRVRDGRAGLVMLAGWNCVLAEWDPAEEAWEELYQSDGLSRDGPWQALRGHGLVFDSHRDSLLLFGGSGVRGSGLSELWEWSFASQEWTLLCDELKCRGPGGRSGHSMVYEPARRRVWLYGGTRDGADPGQGDTWIWSLADERPSQLFAFPRFGTRADDVVLIEALAVRASTGASGEIAGRPAHGARLSLWDGGRYVPLAETDASADGAGVLSWESGAPASWTSSDPHFLDRAFRFGPRRTLHLRLEALAPNGASRARLATDYLELSVRYTWGPRPAPCDPMRLGDCEEGSCYPDDYRGGGTCLPPGSAPTEAPCTAHGDCHQGHVCHAVGGAGVHCLPSCDVRDGDPACGEGRYCTWTEHRWGVCVEERDCEDPASVSEACEAGRMDNCTCAASDPCGWSGDGHCHSYCTVAFPDDHLDEAGDCDDCDDEEALAEACFTPVLNNCTCRSDDPCGWVWDFDCQSECAELFPHDHFDDFADCLAGW